MAKPTADIYLRFLLLTQRINQLPALPLLDPLEERIFQFVALTDPATMRLSVRDLMEQDMFGSPMTIHNRLKSMREKGWLMLADTDDTRRKQVSLTQAALLHMDKLAQCVVQAASEPA